jgi:cytochrome P450
MTGASEVRLLCAEPLRRCHTGYPRGEEFDIHRGAAHLSFGRGLHFCGGSSLARVQARVALEELLKRWPEWDVDYANAAMAHTSSLRWWGTLPVVVG